MTVSTGSKLQNNKIVCNKEEKSLAKYILGSIQE